MNTGFEIAASAKFYYIYIYIYLKPVLR